MFAPIKTLIEDLSIEALRELPSLLTAIAKGNVREAERSAKRAALAEAAKRGIRVSFLSKFWK